MHSFVHRSPCQKGRGRNRELKSLIIEKEADWHVVRGASKMERTCKWFVQFLCVYVCGIYIERGREAEREKREKHSECVCQSQSILALCVWCERAMKAAVWRRLFVSERDRKAERDKERQSPTGGMILSPYESERKVAGLSGSLAVQPCSLCRAYRRRNLK